MALSTCSKPFKLGISWLEKSIKFNEKKLITELENLNKKINDIKDKTLLLGYEKKKLEIKLKVKYWGNDIESFYILNKINSPIINDVLESAKDELFWKDLEFLEFESIHRIRFFLEIGLDKNIHIKEWISEIIKNQTIEGALHSNPEEHTGTMWVLTKIMPMSSVLDNAVKWWLTNWKDYRDIENIPFAILSLIELDYEKYYIEIIEHINYLKTLINEKGYWGKKDIREWRNFFYTSYAVWAISKFLGPNDAIAQKGLKWILKKQRADGSWLYEDDCTNFALLALLAMGEGPKISIEFVENEYMKYKQLMNKQKPLFLHTSPIYRGSLHIKEIYDKIIYMLHNAKKEIRISSLFIDVLYEEIINMTQDNPNIIIKIVIKPKREIKGIRQKIAKNVIDLLEIATKGNVVQSDNIHSRLIIIDDNEMIISSADLTRDQLFDEYNAGIWTCDKITIKKAIDYFDNIFEMYKTNTSK